jgi:two-component system cell cycle sensor histidine kinase/response regulator CckA
MSSHSRLLAQVAGVFVGALGTVALIGWLFNIESLKSIVPGAAPMKPNMAAGFLLCGAAFSFLSGKTVPMRARRCAIAMAATVVLLAALTLGEHFFGWNFPIEQWLIAPDQRILHPGRMASVSALVFLLGGSAVLAKSFLNRKQLPVALVVGLSAGLVVMGVAPLMSFALETLFGSQWNLMGMDLSGVAPAIGFTLLGSGLLALLQSEGNLAWSLDSSITTGFALGFLVILVAAAAGYNFTRHVVETGSWVRHRQEVLKETEEIWRAMTSLANSEHVYAILRDDQVLKDRQTIKTAVNDHVHQFRLLTHDNPNQQRRVDLLEPLVKQRFDWEEHVISAARQEGSTAATRMIVTQRGIELSNEILRLTKEMETEEYALLDAGRNSADSATSTTFALLPLGTFLSLAILSLSAFSLNAGVTERMQAEKALQQSEERYRMLFESNPNPMWVYDLETLSFLAVNNAAVEHYGYSQKEFLARTIKDIRPAEDIPRLIDDLARTNTALGAPTYWRHRKKDGAVIDVEIASHELLWLGRRARVVLVKDVTERKRAEERLQEQAHMLDHAHDAILVRNLDDRRIIFWNNGAERLYGWSSSEAIGHPVDELILANPEELAAISSTLLSTGEFRGQLKEVTKDKREVTVEVWSTVVRNSDGTPRSVLSISNDITEQKKLEAQLLRAQRLESIGTLASGVAHDLNNILTPILVLSQALRSGLDEESRESALSLIEESAQRGAGIVKQVLTFARGVEGERVLIKPSHLIEEMVDIARRTFPKSIDISSRYPKDLWSIEVDPSQLHQVLLNLSVNSRDAMPDGGSLVIWAENLDVDEHYASMTPHAKAGQFVAISVSDTGTGMPRAVLDKIFDPFFTTKEIGKGTGLGLSTTLGIVKSHAGFISVYSEPGKGTTFKVFVPATTAQADLQQAKTSGISIQGNSELILVVDDDSNVLRSTKMILEKHNYKVISANDGPEALALFAQQMHAICGVLTDLAMPYMDGVALVRALRKMKTDIPVIASTGQADQPAIEELQSLGVRNFLTKPYNIERLLTTLRDALEGGGSVTQRT